MSNFEKEYEKFLEDVERDSKRLRLIIEDINDSRYNYNGMKLSDVTPIYSTSRVKIYIPEKKGNPNSKLF